MTENFMNSISEKISDEKILGFVLNMVENFPKGNFASPEYALDFLFEGCFLKRDKAFNKTLFFYGLTGIPDDALKEIYSELHRSWGSIKEILKSLDLPDIQSSTAVNKAFNQFIQYLNIIYPDYDAEIIAVTLYYNCLRYFFPYTKKASIINALNVLQGPIDTDEILIKNAFSKMNFKGDTYTYLIKARFEISVFVETLYKDYCSIKPNII